MEKIPINKNEDRSIFFPLSLINNNYDFPLNKNDYNFFFDNELNSSVSPFPFIDVPKIEQIEKNKLQDKDINQISDIISKKTSNNTKSLLQNKSNNNWSFQGEKNEIDKFSKNNLLCRVKRIIFDSILNYDNYIISKTYDNNIGKGLNIKKLLKNNHLQIKCSGTEFNKELLQKTQGEIFSSDITTKFTTYPIDHNKQLIEKLLNENNREKREIFQNLFSKTLLECIEHLIGKKEYKDLEGLENFFEDEINKKSLNKKNLELLKHIINNYENIINEKKPRKKRVLEKD